MTKAFGTLRKVAEGLIRHQGQTKANRTSSEALLPTWQSCRR